MVAIDDFEKIEIRVGKIIEVREFPEAHKPAYKLTIDFGSDIGIKHSSAQITDHYKLADLKGKLVLGITNLPPRQVGSFMSEVLTLGVPDENGKVVLVAPDSAIPLGVKLY